MSAKKSSSKPRWHKALALALPAVALAGCADYMQRSDTVTLRAGDAAAWNRVVHTADPWPPNVMNTNIPGDGQRTAAVIRRYSTGNAAAAATETTAPAGGAAAPQGVAE